MQLQHFLGMMIKLQTECNRLDKERALKNVLSKIIVGGVLLYGHTAE